MKKLLIIALLALTANLTAQTFDFNCPMPNDGSSIILEPSIRMYHDDEVRSYIITDPTGTITSGGSSGVSGRVNYNYYANAPEYLDLTRYYTRITLSLAGWIDNTDLDDNGEELNGMWSIMFYGVSGTEIGYREFSVTNFQRSY